MKIKSLGRKLIIVTLLSIVIIFAVSFYVINFGNSKLVNEILIKQSQNAMSALNNQTETIKQSTLNLVSYLTKIDSVKDAIQSNKKDELSNIVKNTIPDFSLDSYIITIRDLNGNVLFRLNDDGLEEQSVTTIPKEGSYFELSNNKPAIISSLPIKNANDQTIGTISAEYSLDSPSFVDELKKITGSEVTVFLKDERINTTITIDGKRQVGTKLNEKISKILLEQKQTYSAQADILGSPYMTNYIPILDQNNNVLGIFFTGMPISDIINFQLVNSIVMFVIIITLMIVASLILAKYFKKTITIPLNKIKDVLNEVSKGNLNVDTDYVSQDEIGELTSSTRKLVNTILDLTKSIVVMSDEFRAGELDVTINTSNFDGAYRDVGENINNMIHEIVSETIDILNCVKEIGSGNFEADLPKQPGKKIIINESIDTVRNNLKSVSKDISKLVEEATIGNLEVRTNSDLYKGDWLLIIVGLNNLIDAIYAPISETSSVLKQVSQGNFDVKVCGDYKGEFLTVKNSINNTVTNISSYISEISNVLTAMSKDNLNQEISREYVGEFANIKTSLNMIITRFNNIIADIYSAANQVDCGAKQISQSSYTLAQGTTTQASTIQQLNATITKINENTLANTKNAKEAQQLSQISKDSAIQGDHYMKNMLHAMEKINESSNKIASIIKVIENIAFQTNLLALNATIEAARAGVHGKGFAVVAEEVSNLAGRSQNAAKETAKLIEQSLNSVIEGTEIATTTANTLQVIVSDATKVASIISNISFATDAQSEAINHVTTGISHISDVVSHNVSSSEESASASTELYSEATALKNLVGIFKTKG